MKRKIVMVFCALVLTFGFITVSQVSADSGFDSSYDSGGSWDSGGSDWGSSSSWDSDYSSSYSGGSSGEMSGFEFVMVLIFITFIIVISLLSKRNKSNLVIPSSTGLALDHTKDIGSSELNRFIPGMNVTAFLQERYNDYVAVQKDWMNFNYDGLREKLTDELYNQYEMQLETLKVKNEQNIMKDFTLKDGMLTGINEENGQITATIELLVSFKDYIADNNGKVLRGSNSKLITIRYEMTFVCNLDSKLENCPNCGAKLTDSASQKCEYCGSTISAVAGRWVLSKKESKGQR